MSLTKDAFLVSDVFLAIRQLLPEQVPIPG
jgi:hypothetical protein